MRHSGRPWSIAAGALACVLAIGAAGCGSDDPPEPPGAAPGSVEPIGELAGPTVPLDDTGFDNILVLSVETAGEGRTLIAGEVRLTRPRGSGAGVAEVRIVVDGEEAREAEARQVGDDSLVIACGCELDAGEHEVELQGRSVGGVSPIAARGLVALDGVEYETETPTGGGPLPPAINGSALETDSILLSGAPASLAQLNLSSASTSSEKLLIVAEVGSTRPSVDPAGVALQAGVGGEEAERIASLTAAQSKLDVFSLESSATPGEPVEIFGNIVGGGATELNLRYVVTCPCGLETES